MNLGPGGSNKTITGTVLAQVDTFLEGNQWIIGGMPTEGFPFTKVDDDGGNIAVFRNLSMALRHVGEIFSHVLVLSRPPSAR